MQLKKIIYWLMLFPLLINAQLNDKWVDAGSISGYKVLTGHSVVELQDGRIMVCGGSLTLVDTIYNPSRKSFIYEPKTGVWSQAASLNIGIHSSALTLMPDGKVLSSGGAAIPAVTSYCEVYNPDEDTWTEIDSMNNARTYHTSVLLPGGEVMVIGGRYFDSVTFLQSVSECEIYNTTLHKWENAGSLIEPLYDLPSVDLVNDSLICAVKSLGEVQSAQIYNINTGVWSFLPKVNKLSGVVKAKLMMDSLWVVIDQEGRCEIFNFNTWSWKVVDSTDFSNAYFQLSKLNDRYLLVINGELARTDIFDVKTETWIRAADLPSMRRFYKTTELDDGSVLIVGGIDSLNIMTLRYIPDSTLVGIKNSKKELPLSFTLYQNYPNPFNPSTRIKYSIPPLETLHAKSQQVQLKIYDILGREIATLVNKNQSPGNYEVTFDATGLSSGIYFYTLKVNGYTNTKKLIVSK